MKYQFLENVELSEADIVILPISYEDTVSGKAGTKDAPRAILKASEELEYYDELLQWSPMKYMKISVIDEIKKSKKESIEKFKQKIAKRVKSIPSKKEKLLISLGGEHSITPFITRKFMKKGATVIFLDAHADLRESYQGSVYSHATPAYHLLEQNHKLLMIGIRSIFEDEAIRIKEDKNITLFSDIDIKKKKRRKEMLKQISSLSGDVYLSIDMDAFNPASVPGVGTPQAGGLEWYDALDILKRVFFNKNIDIKGVDIVELIPEKSGVSQIFTAKLLQKIISFWGKSKAYDLRDKLGSQKEGSYE